jgi:hypothetical protein
MKKMLLVQIIVLGSLSGFAGGNDPTAIMSQMKNAKISLVQGIELAEKTSGVVTSAKYEIGDDGKLSLSIYTVPEGLSVAPEKATLTELSGDPTAQPFKFAPEVFTDKEHIARASVHLTLFQLSPLSLKDVIKAALKKVSGTPIDVRNPMVLNKRPVAEVIIHDDSGDEDDFYSVTVDLLNGKIESKEL